MYRSVASEGSAWNAVTVYSVQSSELLCARPSDARLGDVVREAPVNDCQLTKVVHQVRRLDVRMHAAEAVCILEHIQQLGQDVEAL